MIVGGGHNGLTAAAYLARAGQSVLVLERRERLGGACTLERPFADERYAVSPCAYVVGLLDELVIQELQPAPARLRVLRRRPQPVGPVRGRHVASASGSTTPRPSATSRTSKVSKQDIDGYWAYEHLFDEIRKRLRTGERDTLGRRDARRARRSRSCCTASRTMIDIVFSASIADVLDDYIDDQRLKDALFGQGVIAAYGGPKDPGTASIKLMHYQGDLEGQGPVWGYVKGGMGMISFAIADAARRPARSSPTGVPVAEIVPGEGVRLEDGTLIRARTVALQRRPEGRAATCSPRSRPTTATRLEAWKVRSPVVKFNAALTALPEWTAAPGAELAGRARRSTSPAASRTPSARSSAATAASPPSASARSTSRPATTPRPRPQDHHLLSVFGQYAPYELDGTGTTRREEVAQQFIDLIDRFAPDFEDIARGLRGARPAGHRGAHRPDRRQHLPGRGHARPDVGAPADAAHADPRLLLLRRRHPPGRQRDRAQRPQRGDGGAGGRPRRSARQLMLRRDGLVRDRRVLVGDAVRHRRARDTSRGPLWPRFASARELRRR